MKTTQTAGTIEDFLKAQADIMRQVQHPTLGEYTSQADFLVRNGRSFDVKPLPSEVPNGKAQACFANCGKLALHHQRFTYCEGYAAGIIPVLHAWLLDSDGKAIDPTWTGKGRRRSPIGWQYFGVAIKTKFLVSHLLETTKGCWIPVLDDWQHRWPIMTAHTEEWKA